MFITGEIKYHFNGVLQDSCSCHCSRCRNAFSFQASAYALIDADKFKWVSGENLLLI
ncbi:GFA family protein [Shewanella sp. SG41-4]|uniref:GFA family protein n=1 Tax=Shewanella sp. SG41-4 TaxID=2760976 RepID=UPI003FA6E518